MPDDDKQDEIEFAFVESWNGVVDYYEYLLRFRDKAHNVYKNSQKALAFIDEIRHCDYDRKSRAGIKLSELILSRAEKHGLRKGQHYIHIQFSETEPLMIVFYHGDTIEWIKCNSIELTVEVRALLDRLVAQPID